MTNNLYIKKRIVHECLETKTLHGYRILYIFKGSLIDHILQILDFFLFDLIVAKWNVLRSLTKIVGLLLPVILAAGEGEMGLQGLGGQVGGDCRSQSWPPGGGRELSWTPEGERGPPHSLQGARLSLKAQGLCPPGFPIPARNMGKKGSGW